MRTSLLWLAPLALAGFLTAQPAAAPIGWRTAIFQNPTEAGSRELASLVYYPAAPGQRGERKVALADAGERGHPVVVMLHGLGSQAAHLKALGTHLARRGYVVVLTDTTSRDRTLQATNARAFYAALRAENAREDAFFHGAFDLDRVGIAGHSMGGGNAARVLANNPGYRAGFCFASWTTGSRGNRDYVQRYGEDIAVPLGIVHGVRDRILPWRRNAMRLLEAGEGAFRALWVADESVTHANVAVPFPPTDQHRQAFDACARLATAFFDRFLRERQEPLEAYLDADSKPGWIEAVHLRES